MLKYSLVWVKDKNAADWRSMRDQYFGPAIWSALVLLGSFSSSIAGENKEIKQSLLAARTQEDMVRIYREIDVKFGGDKDKIIESLRENGFSCKLGSGFVKANCVFAYCGDAITLQKGRELMSISVVMTEKWVNNSVIHQQTVCPESTERLQKKQDYLLNGGG